MIALPIENRVKGIFLLLLSIIYLSLFLVGIFYIENNAPDWIKYIFVILSLLLIITSAKVYRLSRKLKIIEDTMILILSFFIACLIVYLSNGADSPYFPIAYIIPLVYSAFIMNNLFIVIYNIISITAVVIWIELSEKVLLEFFDISDAIKFIIFVTFILVIRNYPLRCLSCKLEKDSCFRSRACIYYRLKWVEEIGDE